MRLIKLKTKKIKLSIKSRKTLTKMFCLIFKQ